LLSIYGLDAELTVLQLIRELDNIHEDEVWSQWELTMFKWPLRERIDKERAKDSQSLIRSSRR